MTTNAEAPYRAMFSVLASTIGLGGAALMIIGVESIAKMHINPTVTSKVIGWFTGAMVIFAGWKIIRVGYIVDREASRSGA